MGEDESISRPADIIEYVAKKRGLPTQALNVPQFLMLTYHRSSFDFARKLINGNCFEWLFPESQLFSIGSLNGLEVGIGCFGMGAPAVSYSLEEAIACGAKIIFEVGFCGGIQPYIQPGDVLVVTGAIRDEGTSYHYFPPEVEVMSDSVMRDELIRLFKRKAIRHFTGSVWSTDGAYRETRRKLLKFRNEGVLAVDMETSAVFAVAKYRNIRAASAQVVSDLLTENGWRLEFGNHSVEESMKNTLQSVLETFSRITK